ncbi:acetoacetate--CoA ligase [Blastococcus sp. CT_GayMR19]|nr:acetoacetate--CoA ligase [Blastococcus sp. CT_GayMR19]
MSTSVRSPLERGTGGRVPQIAAFREACEGRTGEFLGSPEALHAWSVDSYRDFWGAFLDWSGLAWEGSATEVCTDDDIERAVFFPGVRLNYAENLLRPLPGVDDDAPALTSLHASPGGVEQFSRRELRGAVARTAAVLGRLGIDVGDRVAVIAPNHARAVSVSLAVAARGATLSTVTPDMGPTALIGRLEQVEPVLLLVDRTQMPDSADGGLLATLLAALPSVRQLVVLDDLPLPELPDVAVDRLSRLEAEVAEPATETWPRLPFNQPLWVMFSSGTTGPPKAMVHGAGGSLIEHVKEHRLHGDLTPDDVLYFHTTTAWMMWNWQLSALAVGAHVVLYDGPIAGPETLWRLVADQGVTVFGTSPPYLQLCQDAGYRPAAEVDLGRLRAVLSTGAVLHDWQFDWVAREVGPVPLQSVSGGTDIIGCFVLGHPERPVERGWCQSIGLGLDVAALDDEGRPVLDEVGELVCRRPFPSRPLCFLRDPDGSRFHDAYFADHAGLWTHGDLITIGRDGGARMHGRSDGVLNISGIRIGPAEIYRILRAMPEVLDSMAVEQLVGSDSRLLLLVVLRPGAVFDDQLAARIRARLRTEGSAAHVPQVVVPVDELPTTHNGKRSERAARDAVNGAPVRNLAALKNPGSLDAIRDAVRAAAERTAEAPAGEPDSADRVTAAVSLVFRDVLGVSSIDHTANFFDLGGTSRQSMTILRRLRNELRRPVPVDTFLAAPTVEGLAEALRRPAVGGSRFPVLKAGEASEAPLYLVHGVYGDVDGYRGLCEHLDTRATVYGIEGSLIDPSGRAKTIEEIAAENVAELSSFQPTGPVRLAGFSFGGLVAFEMARQLAEAGRTPEHLALLDVRPPKGSLTRFENLLRKASTLIALFIPAFHDRTLGQAIRDRFRKSATPSDRQALRGGVVVYDEYRWQRYEGPVTYFRARVRLPVIMCMLFAWRRAAPNLRVVGVPGEHDDLLDAHHAQRLAERMSEALRA